MSLFQDVRFPCGTRIVLWKTDRPEEELRSSALARSNPEFIAHVFSEAEVRFRHARRRCEWLAVRACMAQVLHRVDVRYHSNGKPYLPGSELSISISHTEGIVAVALEPHVLTGVDVQTTTQQVLRLEPKLCSEEERAFLSSDNDKRILQLSLIFSMKEALYKALDEPCLLYRTAFCVKPFSLQEEGDASMVFIRNNFEYPFTLHYKNFGRFVLTFVTL